MLLVAPNQIALTVSVGKMGLSRHFSNVQFTRKLKLRSETHNGRCQIVASGLGENRRNKLTFLALVWNNLGCLMLGLNRLGALIITHPPGTLRYTPSLIFLVADCWITLDNFQINISHSAVFIISAAPQLSSLMCPAQLCIECSYWGQSQLLRPVNVQITPIVTLPCHVVSPDINIVTTSPKTMKK